MAQIDKIEFEEALEEYISVVKYHIIPSKIETAQKIWDDKPELDATESQILEWNTILDATCETIVESLTDVDVDQDKFFRLLLPIYKTDGGGVKLKEIESYFNEIYSPAHLADYKPKEGRSGVRVLRTWIASGDGRGLLSKFKGMVGKDETVGLGIFEHAPQSISEAITKTAENFVPFQSSSPNQEKAQKPNEPIHVVSNLEVLLTTLIKFSTYFEPLQTNTDINENFIIDNEEAKIKDELINKGWSFNSSFVSYINTKVYQPPWSNDKMATNLLSELYKRLKVPSKGTTGSEKTPQFPVLGNFLLTNNYKPRGTSEFYIRWDAFCQLLNNYIIPPLGDSEKIVEGNPMVAIQDKYLVNKDKGLKTKSPTEAGGDWVTDRSGAHFAPLLFKDMGEGKGISEGGSWENLDLNVSANPKVCLLPGNIKATSNNWDSISSNLNTMYPLWLSGFINDGELGVSKNLDLIKMNRLELKAKEKIRSIGFIWLNINNLLEIYFSMEGKGKGNLKEEFNIGTYLKSVWDSVNKACGGNHNFLLHTDPEFPHIVRIIDLLYDSKDSEFGLDPFTLNVDGTATTVRDYSYNSAITKDILTTVSIAAQNPDSTDDLDALTFKAFNRSVRNRFLGLSDSSDDTSETKIKSIKERYKKKYSQFLSVCGSLMGHLKDLYTKGATVVGDEEISKGTQDLETSQTLRLWLKNNIYQGEESSFRAIPKAEQTNTPSIIPLKLNITLDGISGIIIGNVFKIDKSRLPRAYHNSKVGFIVMGEEQNITAGGDWTTKITGQMNMLGRDEISDKEQFKITINQKDDKAEALDNVDTTAPTPTDKPTKQNIKRLTTAEKDKLVAEGMDYLINEKGSNKYLAAGIIGNFNKESGMVVNILEWEPFYKNKSHHPGILQARTLEWVASSFSNA